MAPPVSVVVLVAAIGRAHAVRSKVELFEAIRRDHRREGLSIRALSDKYEVHRRTVRQALESAVPPERKVPVRVAPKLMAHARDSARTYGKSDSIDALFRRGSPTRS